MGVHPTERVSVAAGTSTAVGAGVGGAGEGVEQVVLGLPYNTRGEEGEQAAGDAASDAPAALEGGSKPGMHQRSCLLYTSPSPRDS